MRWVPACNAVRYELCRRTSATMLNFCRTVDGTSFIDRENVQLGTLYYYQVRGIRTNSRGEIVRGAPSNIASGRAIRYLDHSGGFDVNGDLVANGTTQFTANVARLTIAANNQFGTFFSDRRVRIR